MPKVGFDGYHRGMLSRPGPRAVPRGYVRGALNLIMVGGRPTSRPGLRPAHGAAFGAPIRGGGVHYNADGTRDYLIAAGAALYRMPLFGDPVALPLTMLPSTEKTRVDPTGGVRFCSLSGADTVTFITDGVNPNLKWDGTDLTKMGLPTPGVPAVPTVNAGAAIGSGTRDYYQTVRSSVHESDLSQATRVVQGVTGGQDFASPTDGVDFDDPQVTRWSLYRTQAGLAERYIVGTADLGVPIMDNLSDLLLTSPPILAEGDVNIPPSGLFVQLCEHQSLVWGFDVNDRSLVHFSWGTSQYMTPEGWPTINVIPVAHGDGDEITAIASFFDWLVVFKQLSTWAIFGDLDAGYTVVPILAASGGVRQGIGCIAPTGIQHLENEIIFPSRDGVYVLNRFAGAQAGLSCKKLSDAIDESYNCLNVALGAASLFDRQKRVYCLLGHG